MRITGVHVFELSAPLEEPFRWATGTALERRAALVKIETDAHIAGWGEALNPQAASIISNVLVPSLIGCDPEQPEPLKMMMLDAIKRSKQTPALNVAAIGAVEMALWDIAGKAVEQPSYRLLGRKQRDCVAVYASGFYYTASNATSCERDASRYLNQGFTRIKMKVGGLSAADDLRRVAAVRTVIGADVPLMVDANQSFDVNGAARFSSSLRDFDVAWLEEPIRSDDTAGYCELKPLTRIPIAAGENLQDLESFEPFIAGRLLGVAQPNVGNVGGLKEALTIACRAQEAGMRVAFHHWGTPVALAASLQVACCLPSGDDSPLVEFDCTPNPLRQIVGGSLMRVSAGNLSVTDQPGLGLEVDESSVERFCQRINHQRNSL